MRLNVLIGSHLANSARNKVRIVPVQEVSEVLRLALEKLPAAAPKAKPAKASPAPAPKTVMRKGARA